MALNDVHKLSLVSTYQGVSCINLFYFQTSDVGTAGTDYDNVLAAFVASYVPQIATIAVSDWVAQAATVRTLKPAITATKTEFINVAGDLTGTGLPSTCTQQITAWPVPMQNRRVAWWRFTGIQQAAQNRGLLDNAQFGLLQDLGNFFASGPITNNDWEFRHVTKPRPTDVPGAALSPIAWAEARAQILNQRSRQFRILTG